MDFLLSFRLHKSPVKIKPSRRITKIQSSSEPSAFISFLFLSLDNWLWEFLQIHGIVLRFIFSTYIISFIKERKSLHLLDYLTFVLDAFFLVDVISCIIYRCKWPKEKTPAEKLTSQMSRLVWRNALYRPKHIIFLFIDVISLLPFNILAILMRSKLVYNIIECIPFLRLYRLMFFYVRSIQRIFLGKTEMLQLILKFCVLWFLACHLFVCIYHWYAKYTNSPFLDGLAKASTFNPNSSFDLYTAFFYNIQFAMGNIGFGEVFPAKDGERLLVSVIMVVGFSLINGYLISALSSLLGEKIRRVTFLRFRISIMKSELRSRRVPEEKIKKVIKFYYSLWVLRQGVNARKEMLVSLPDSLWSQVHCDIYMPALNASLLFRSCDDPSKRALAQAMETELYMTGDVILKRNEINSAFFYIRKGTIELMSYQDDETQIVAFGAGSVFGQIALLLSLPARSEIHAATFCEVHKITRKNLFLVLQDYQKAKDIIFNVHKNLLLNMMADKFKEETKVGDDETPLENLLTSQSFYKVPLEASRIARNDICIVSNCPYVFEPNTIFSTIWEILVVLIILTISFYYPYCAVFDRKYPKRIEAYIIITDIILIINLYITFSTGFIKENILFSSLRDIVKSKLVKVSTYIDIMAVSPLPYFLNDDNRVKPLLLCLRCLELYKVHFLFSKTESSVSVTIIGYLRLIKYVLYFFLIGYAAGLVYYLEACYNDPCIEDSWYPNNNVTAESGSPTWSSLYTAMQIVSGLGYGDVTPKNLVDMRFFITSSLIGVFLFIYLIAEFSAYLSLYSEPRNTFLDLVDRINSFLVTNKMLPSERIRVRQFLNLQWEKNKGYEFTQESDLFHDTPKHFVDEIGQITKSRGLDKFKIFRELDSEVIRLILRLTSNKNFPPHEVVIYANEVLTHLLMLEEGFCEVIYGKGSSDKKIIGPGYDICTVEAMLGLTSLCNVRTLTHCTFIRIEKILFMGCLRTNPYANSELKSFFEEFKNSSIVKEIQELRPIHLHLIVRPPTKKSIYRYSSSIKRGKNEWRNPFVRLGLCQWIRYVLIKKTILPYGRLIKIWELSRSLFAFLSAMLFPLLPYFQLQVPVLKVIAYILDVTAWIDLYFRGHVCYYNTKNILVSHPLWTWAFYLKGSFFLDFAICFPFDVIMFRPVYDATGYAFVTTKPINYLRILRAIQIYRIPKTVQNLGVDFLSPPSLYRVLIMMTLITLVFLNVLSSFLLLDCMNYKANKNGEYFAVFDDSVKEFFDRIQKKYNFTTEPFTMYFVTLYWVTETATALGCGDITAINKKLMVFVIIVIILSYLYFNYVTIIIASYLSNVNTNLTIYQKRMSHMIQFLKSENVEPMLRQHIINHFENTWEKQKGMKPQSVFKNFNLALKNDLLLYLYEETLKNVGAFANIDRSFFRVVSSYLYEMNFRTGAGIYKQGDIISDLYIIHVGEVTLVGRNEEETVTLGPSMIFGHIDMTPRSIATLSPVATKNLTVLRINTFSLYKLIQKMKLRNKNIGNTENSELENLKEALAHSNEYKMYKTSKKKFKTKSFGKTSFHYVTHRFSKYTSIFYVALSLFSVNEVSYNAAFQPESLAYWCALIPIEILFVLKIFLGFNTGYVDDAGDFILDSKLIRRRYMKLSGFYLDFIPIIPLEIFCLAFEKKDRHYSASLLRLTKLLRINYIRTYFNMRIDKLSVKIILVKIVTVVFWTGSLIHQCTCAWYFVSCHRGRCPDSATWNHALDGDFHNHYLSSLYFVISEMTTTGIGDIFPTNMLEFFFLDVLELVAIFHTAIFIGQIISTVQKSLFAKTSYEFAVAQLKTYLDVNDIPKQTQMTVLQYIQNIWINEKGQQIPLMLKDAPPYLINEIKQSTYGHHINNNPVFKACHPFFRKQIISKLRRTVFYPGNIIVNEGEVNRTMYFVHAGLVEGRDEKNLYQMKIYSSKSFFGLRQGVLKREPHIRTFTAKTLCEILSLKVKQWEFLIEFYPLDIEHIKKEAHNNRWA